jgi:phage-related tail protein
MSFRIMARSTDSTTGFAKRTAAEALQAVRELSGEGFQLTAVIDDDGNAVPMHRLEELAATEAAPSR